jgi:hypothetical protein
MMAMRRAGRRRSEAGAERSDFDNVRSPVQLLLFLKFDSIANGYQNPASKRIFARTATSFM